MYSDNLTFSEEGLALTIETLKELEQNTNLLKEKYMDYVNSNLKPNWTTTRGVQSIEELMNFAENDIQNFITYLQNRITSLENTQPKINSIDNA